MRIGGRNDKRALLALHVVRTYRVRGSPAVRGVSRARLLLLVRREPGGHGGGDVQPGRRHHEAEGVQQQFIKQVKPMHDQYVEPTKAFANCVVVDAGHFETTLEDYSKKLSQL